MVDLTKEQCFFCEVTDPLIADPSLPSTGSFHLSVVLTPPPPPLSIAFLPLSHLSSFTKKKNTLRRKRAKNSITKKPPPPPISPEYTFAIGSGLVNAVQNYQSFFFPFPFSFFPTHQFYFHISLCLGSFKIFAVSEEKQMLDTSNYITSSFSSKNSCPTTPSPPPPSSPSTSSDSSSPSLRFFFPFI